MFLYATVKSFTILWVNHTKILNILKMSSSNYENNALNVYNGQYYLFNRTFYRGKCLVRVMRDGEPKIYRWDDGTNRYFFQLINIEEEYLTTETIFQIIKELMPETDGSVQNVGKPIKAVFGENFCWSRRKDNKTWYKISRK